MHLLKLACFIAIGILILIAAFAGISARVARNEDEKEKSGQLAAILFSFLSMGFIVMMVFDNYRDGRARKELVKFFASIDKEKSTFLVDSLTIEDKTQFINEITTFKSADRLYEREWHEVTIFAGKDTVEFTLGIDTTQKMYTLSSEDNQFATGYYSSLRLLLQR
ncbi:MAG: hypothetical protein H7Z72_16140 [Bacteroidetes bacterium]|nr:hypothetical protein [Fibrella sp.]